MTKYFEVDDFSDEQIEKLKKKIEYAREWAKKHFNYDGRLETRLVDENMMMFPPSFFVEFPTPDTMKVAPSFMGRPMGLWILYKLSFRLDEFGTPVWNGINPMTLQPYPPLVVE